MGDIRDGEGFYRNGKFYWLGQEDKAFEDQIASKDRRERVNGPEPRVHPYCNCGAKFDREFPNIHSPECSAYTGNK